MSRCKCRPRGLTLVELMVVLAITAVLASLAVPPMGRQLARWKLQAAAEHLAADLSDARHDAAQLGQSLQVQVASGSAWCWSVSAAPACSCEGAQACQRKRVDSDRYRSVRIDEAASFSFAATSEARLAAARVPMSTSYGDRLQVLVTPLGRARVCAPETAWSSYSRC